MVTSGINFLAHGGRLQNASALEDLMPQIPKAGKIVLSPRARREIGVKFDSLAPVHDFFAASQSAQEDLRGYCDDAEQFGADEAAFLGVAHLRAAWHDLSRRALAAVVALEGDVSRCLPQRYTGNTPVLKTLLLEVIKGGHPCVDAEGMVRLPNLPQRRAAMRPNVHLPCVLEHKGQTSRAVAKDISTGGVGLVGAPGLTPQTVILVDFEDGHCFAGLVVWSRGDQAGIKFDVPLNASHPLLVAPRGSAADPATC